MAVLIEGMEMPKSCIFCELYEADWYWCRAAKKEYYETIENKAHPDWCPLVPVPPHGIIDREQILDAIRLELAQANAVNDMDDYDEWMRVFDYIRKFPTVIPAEEGE